ncbi:MPN domain-containing protein [Mycena kentingensis (nom. inval.)]|nr:MPN domain-containing protein [Mycena kentingensis (nom. inval.)]
MTGSITVSLQEGWWTTSTINGSKSVFLPTRTSSTASSSLPPSTSAASTLSTNTLSGPLTTFTSTFPTTVMVDTTTFTSLAESVVTTPVSALATETFGPVGAQANSNNPVCIGKGTDASTDGLLASIIVPSAVGLLIWVMFAILRPRFRQVYALREWFVETDLRPKPVGSGFFAFLHPPVPFVPPVPTNVDDMGKSPAGDAELFPSDEALSQRALWIALLIAMGWALLGLGGALPLYMINMPCLANGDSPAAFGGSYSTLEDLSLMRLLRAIQDNSANIETGNLIKLSSRALLAGTGEGDPQHLRIRVIVLTAITLVLGLLPPLWKIIKELRRLILYRKRWLEYRCEGKQLGWLSARYAPGFAGWGEQRFKDFVVKSGLSSGVLGGTERPRRSPDRDDQPNEQEKDALQVDITNIYSICDTQRLALLIDERDEILENLEMAETRYISSFRITTPDPSVADFEAEAVIPTDPNRPYISHPQPLRQSTRRPRRKRSMNPAYASSSLSPTSFVAPSVYYKLNRIQNISGGQFGGEGAIETSDRQSLTEKINSRLVGSRFQEVNRNSAAFGRLPLGSPLRVDQTGELGPMHSIDEHGYFKIPDPQRYGPNGVGDEDEAADWVDVFNEHHPRAEESEDNGPGPSSSLSSPFRRRHASGSGTTPNTTPNATLTARGDDSQPNTATKRETFPFRRRKSSAGAEEMPPPHMRLQRAQPFVRPLDGVDFDHLGTIYGAISQWRARLKAINTEISEAQTTGYEDIAAGTRIKGWLIIGRGLRFIDGIEIIEGMAKEDVRWDVLQNERGPLDAIVLGALLGIATILLMAGLTAAAGLALTTAPDVSHYLPLLKPLVDSTSLIPVGLATVLAPAVAASLFITLAVMIINFSAQIYGSASVSGTQLFVFQTMFYILVGIGAIWLITVGALIYTLQAFNSSNGIPSPTTSVADGSIYMAIVSLSIIFTVAIVFPGLLLLQPFRLYRVLRAQKRAVTPRQHFRALYPRTYNPAFAMGACILAIIFASTFAIIFPLVAPAVVVLLLLSLVAHRFLVGYVFARTHSQTGGLLQIWLLRRFGTLLSFQPILLGLIFLSREFWIEGGVLVGAGFFVIVLVETYTFFAMRQPGTRSLSPITRESLKSFMAAAKPSRRRTVDDESTSLVSSARPGHRTRGSMASVLEMMSVTLAVMPPRKPESVSLPLKTETLDDLSATERAARTHPEAPPHLPPLSFTDHAQEMASILYAPELIAPPPIIWLPNDSAGVARSEAVDLQRYHDLQVTLDVRSKDDALKSAPTRTRMQPSSGSARS